MDRMPRDGMSMDCRLGERLELCRSLGSASELVFPALKYVGSLPLWTMSGHISGLFILDEATAVKKGTARTC